MARSELVSKFRFKVPFSTKEINPVSSDTMTVTASVPSVMPMAARWRVPSSREMLGFFVSGKNTEAAAMRSL